MAESRPSAARRCNLSLHTFLSLKALGEAACGCAQTGGSALGMLAGCLRAGRTVGAPEHPADPLGSVTEAPVPRWIQSLLSAYEASHLFRLNMALCGENKET